MTLLVCQQLEHGVDVSAAPVIKAVDLPLVAHQRKADRRTQLEAMFNGELLVNGLHHGEDFCYLALGSGEIAAGNIEEMLHRAG